MGGIQCIHKGPPGKVLETNRNNILWAKVASATQEKEMFQIHAEKMDQNFKFKSMFWGGWSGGGVVTSGLLKHHKRNE